VGRLFSQAIHLTLKPVHPSPSPPLSAPFRIPLNPTSSTQLHIPASNDYLDHRTEMWKMMRGTDRVAAVLLDQGGQSRGGLRVRGRSFRGITQRVLGVWNSLPGKGVFGLIKEMGQVLENGITAALLVVIVCAGSMG